LEIFLSSESTIVEVIAKSFSLCMRRELRFDDGVKIGVVVNTDGIVSSIFMSYE